MAPPPHREVAPMKLKISNRAEAFFDLFTESAENLRAAAELLQDLIGDYRDIELKAQKIADREHEGDEVTHAIIRLLNTTFVTPMDREDIYQLATALDDVMDAIEAVSDLFVLHRIEAPLPEMKAQIDVLVLAARQTEQALAELSNMRRERLEPYWIEINRLENEGDQLYRRAIADLFSGEHRAMDVLKWKEVIENLEEALDGLENVANIIESTVLKHT
jgi:predicted phosphate transport protein (TIGR00153 family)